MAELQSLQRQRRSLKIVLSKTVNNLERLVEEHELNFDIITEKIKSFESNIDKYRNIQLECCGLTEEEKLDEIVETETDYEDSIVTRFVKVRAAVESRRHSEREAQEPSLVANAFHSQQRSVYDIPHVSLPRFSGQLADWLAFIQSFENSVHNTTIPDAVKLTILRNHLEGEALETIRLYSLTDQNYASALQALKERYGETNKLVEFYVEQLINLKTKATQQTLRQTYDQLLSIVSMLENLEVQREQYAVLLVPMLKTVFPYHVQIKWVKYERNFKTMTTTNTENRLTLFLRFLKEEVDIIESTQQRPSPQQNQYKNHVPTTFRKGKQGDSTANFQTSILNNSSSFPYSKVRQGKQSSHNRQFTHSTSNMRSGNKPPPCCFCKAKMGQHFDHHPRNCQHANTFTPTRARELISQDKRCLRCLGPRPSSECSCRYHCYICYKNHHTLLCEARKETTLPPNNSSNSSTQTATDQVNFLTRKTTDGANQTLIPTVTVHIAAQKQTTTRIILDTGSQRTYINKSLADRICAPTVANEFLGFEGFGGKRESPKDTALVSFSLFSPNNNHSKSIQINALVTPQITTTKFAHDVDTSQYPHLENLTFADSDSNINEVGVLIGQDFIWDILDGEVRKGNTGEPVAMNTIFGYTLAGNTQGANPVETCNFFCKETVMCHDMETFWSLESLGIVAEKSNEDEAVESYMQSVKFKDGHYEVGLPWKTDHPTLINNKEKAQARLYKLNQKLNKQPELRNQYQIAIQELIDEGFVEEVPNSDPKNNEFYLPHRPVIKQGTSSYKCRPVFDASAEDLNGISLNDCLLTGPSLLPNILNIILQFRWWEHGLVGDIKRAFLQIGIDEKDRDMLRFLWQEKTYRFTKVPFGLCSSPYHLNQTIQLHLSSYPHDTLEDQELLQELSKSFYVDDLIIGADSHETLCNKLKRSSAIMSDAGMTLRNWASSDCNMHAKFADQYEFDNDNEELNVLGLTWNRTTDTLQPKVPVWDVKNAFTKRNILSHLGQIFDPLGLLSPLTIQGKLIVQKLWKESAGWDDEVSSSIQAITTEFVHNCSKLQSLSFSRTLRHPDENAPVSLHIYCDASNQACGTVAYLRQDKQSNIVAAKTKVAPLNNKTMSLPRLELVACLLGVRLVNSIKKTEQFSQLPVHFYSDSNIALSWIAAGVGNKTQREVFINNRVKEILQTSKPSDWNYVSTDENPADLVTRDSSINKLMTNDGLKLWLHGPDVPIPIQLSCLHDEHFDNHSIFNCTIDQNATAPKVVNIATAASVHGEEILDLNRFSDLRKVLKITAYVLRFKNRITKAETEHSKTIVAGQRRQSVPTPSFEEMERAKYCWIKIVQKEHFNEEIKLLEMNKLLSKQSCLYPLRPTLADDGLLKSVGRNQKRPPILLPRNEQFTNLIVKDIHNHNFHAGVNFTLCQLRQTFWIIRGRQTVKRIINECLTCKRHRALPYSQIVAPLPAWRVSEQRPFETVGMDFCGPFNITEGKAYILIFSCAVTRACHLELTPDMSTHSVYQGLRRMTSRRGCSKLIVCDNARSFQKLRQSLQSDIKFYFIPPYAPWFGGFYERLNSSIKTALKKTLGRTNISFQEFHTLLTEIESFINHRPLTHVTDDVGDPLPLRPIDFLQTPTPLPQPNATTTQEKLALRFKHRRTVLASVWKQWRHQYLHQLHKWQQNKTPCCQKNPKIGDVVMIDPFTVKNKALFPLGRITDVLTGRDGVVRSVHVKTEKGVIHRATKHIYPLETDGNETSLPVLSPAAIRSADQEFDSTETQISGDTAVPSTHSLSFDGTTPTLSVPKRHSAQRSTASSANDARDSTTRIDPCVTSPSSQSYPSAHVTRHGRKIVRPARFRE